MSAAVISACADSTSARSPNGLPPSETNFSWCRRARGNSSSFSASTVAFMNGAGPHTNASYVEYAVANALQLGLGRESLHRLEPVHDLQPVRVLGGELGQLVAKITDFSSRLA